MFNDQFPISNGGGRAKTKFPISNVQFPMAEDELFLFLQILEIAFWKLIGNWTLEIGHFGFSAASRREYP
jgi:hypothetical protein